MTTTRFEPRVGTRVPATDFQVIRDGMLAQCSSREVFDGRTVVVFALPGAFTPTCSSSHVPRYNELADLFAAHGVDEIVCISVNDAFVMDAWARDQKATRVTFLADGNGDFSRGMGLLVDRRELGFGPRSWRYSMLVRDGVIERQFIEPDQPGDPFVVSDADTMIGAIAPGATAALHRIAMISRPGCGHCARARRALAAGNLRFEEIELGGGLSVSSLHAISGRGTTPQVFIDGERIGGADELEAWLAARMAIAA